MRYFSLLLAFGLFLSAIRTADARTDVFAWTYGIYLSSMKDEDKKRTKLNRFDRGVTIGFISTDWDLLLGFNYGSEEVNETVRDDNDREIEYQYEKTNYGVSFGYIQSEKSGPFLLGNYIYKSKKRSESQQLGRYSTPVEYYGDGYEIMLGHRIVLGKVHLSFHVAYRRFEYDEKKTNGSISPLDPMTKESYIIPYLGIWTQF